MIDGYTDVAVVVSDAQKAKRWYVEKLGFKVTLDKGHAICVSPNTGGQSLMLHLCGDGFAPLEPGNTGIGFTADDFYKTCDEMKGGCERQQGSALHKGQRGAGHSVAQPAGNYTWNSSFWKLAKGH